MWAELAVSIPYAVLEPVNIAGATVRQATLHNEDYIRSKDLLIGDWVVVERAGRSYPADRKRNRGKNASLPLIFSGRSSASPSIPMIALEGSGAGGVSRRRPNCAMKIGASSVCLRLAQAALSRSSAQKTRRCPTASTHRVPRAACAPAGALCEPQRDGH